MNKSKLNRYLSTNILNNNKDKDDIDVEKIKKIEKINKIKINKIFKSLIRPSKKLRRISLFNLI